MNYFEYELPNEIMTCDLYIAVADPNFSGEHLKEVVLKVVARLRDFEAKYSRFIEGNFLHMLNLEQDVAVDSETLELLRLCYSFYTETAGLFDPTVLDLLLEAGYVSSKREGFFTEKPSVSYAYSSSRPYSFGDIRIDLDSSTVTKPQGLLLDFGGIGKSYIVSKIANSHLSEFEHFCISLGGDMYLKGKDVFKNYNYWAIEVENPFSANLISPTLLLSDIAVATSGVNKRTWIKDGTRKNHIVNPLVLQDTKEDIISCTLISKDLVFADVMAKVLLLKGYKAACEFCEQNLLPAVFFNSSGACITSSSAKEFIWGIQNEG